MNPLDLVKLTPLMERTSGRPEIAIGLIDGPVAIKHPDLADGNIREIPGKVAGSCSQASGSNACMHGTFVAGILSARRDSVAPAICPKCTLLLRPIFKEEESGKAKMPSASPDELAEAIINIVIAGAKVINLSSALTQPSLRSERKLEEALDYTANRGVLVVAAAGNLGEVGSSAITRHPWVIAVVASDITGRPISQSNLGNSIGKQGLSAPGDNITSLGVDGKPRKFGGTSAAAPFVTGTIALLWSEYPAASATQVKLAVTQVQTSRRTTIVPPLLDAWGAYRNMKPNF